VLSHQVHLVLALVCLGEAEQGEFTLSASLLFYRILAVKAGVNVNTEEMKSSTIGQTVKDFYDVSTNSSSEGK